MDATESFEKNKILNFFAFIIESLSLYAHTLVKHYSHLFKKLMEDFQVAELFDALSDRLSGHPPLKFVVFSVALSCAVPVILFIGFVILSIIITFAGFLFVEGTLLAVGGLCMFVCIITMILILSMLGMMFGAFYLITLKLKGVFNKFENSSKVPQNLVSLANEESET